MSNISPTDSDLDDNFQVFARIRPPTPREVNIVEGFQSPRADIKYSSEHFPVYNSIDPPSCLLKTTENFIFLYDPLSTRRDKPFVFDGVYNEVMNNKEVYQKCVKPNLENLFQGYNTTFFAYGNTGSGKTHTIFGGQEEKGIFLMACEEILERIKTMKNRTFCMNFSYLEIYNENVRDLLSETQKSLSMVEDPIKGVYVPELKQNAVFTLDQILHQINIGNQKRALAATFSNQYSSRSHAILQLVIETKTLLKNQGLDENCVSKLTFVDLAGSEKAFISLDNKSKGILEGSNINKSLLALGNCINILSEKNKKGSHVPYRDSKLTRLLKDSLGGNTKTIMIACISPSMICLEETLNTLNYAKRARNIKKKVYRNILESNDEADNAKNREKIQSLMQKVDLLNKIINAPAICQTCKMVIKNDKSNNYMDFVEPFRKGGESYAYSEDLVGIYKSKNNKLIQDKNELLKSLKTFEMQLIEIKQDGNDRISNNGSSSEYLERICKDIMANIEENFEIKQSLKELDDLILQNNTNLKMLSERFGNLDDHFYEIDELDEEISMIKKNNIENIEIKNKLLSALSINQTQKNILLDLMLKITDEKKAIILEKDIALKKKQLENIDISFENNELMKELHLKERILQEKERNIKHDFAESKTLVTFDNSPINIKNQIDINQKRVNSSILSNKNLLTPPHLEPQKYYGASNYLMVKSPKTDLIKKNKSDCYNNEENPKEIINNVCEGQMTIKKIENLKNNKIFNQESYKSPYKTAFASDFHDMNLSKSKLNKENIHPSTASLNQNSETMSKQNETEKLNLSSYLQNKKFKKSPIITTIELFKALGENKNEDPLISPKDIFKKTSTEKLKKKRTTSTSKRYDIDQAPSQNIILKEFNVNMEEPQKFNELDSVEIQERNTIENDFLNDSLNYKNENPLISQSLKKFKPFSDFVGSKKEESGFENNVKTKQSFEDFKNMFLHQNKLPESPLSNFIDFMKNKNESDKKENKRDDLKKADDIACKTPHMFNIKNFDSANKNPMESESENDTEKNLMGSPIIQKSSRNYYTNAKGLANMHNRGTFKINE